MKNAAQVLLKISSILDLVLSIILYVSAGLLLIVTGFISLTMAIPATFLLLASIFAKKSMEINDPEPLITTTVFAFLSGELVALTGCVLGLVHYYTTKDKEEKKEKVEQVTADEVTD